MNRSEAVSDATSIPTSAWVLAGLGIVAGVSGFAVRNLKQLQWATSTKELTFRVCLLAGASFEVGALAFAILGQRNHSPEDEEANSNVENVDNGSAQISTDSQPLLSSSPEAVHSSVGNLDNGSTQVSTDSQPLPLSSLGSGSPSASRATCAVTSDRREQTPLPSKLETRIQISGVREYGLGGLADLAEARTRYAEVVQAGHSTPTFLDKVKLNLAGLHRNGFGGPANLVEAKRLYEEIVTRNGGDSGDGQVQLKAKFWLAHVLRFLPEGETNPARSRMLYQQIINCPTTDTPLLLRAKRELAYLLRQPLGGPKREDRARALLEEVVACSDADMQIKQIAEHALGFMLINGEGGTVNMERGRRLKDKPQHALTLPCKTDSLQWAPVDVTQQTSECLAS